MEKTTQERLLSLNARLDALCKKCGDIEQRTSKVERAENVHRNSSNSSDSRRIR